MSTAEELAAEITNAINAEMRAKYPHSAEYLADYHAALVKAVASVVGRFLLKPKEHA